MHSAITKRLLESGMSSFWHFWLVFLALFEFEVLSVSSVITCSRHQIEIYKLVKIIIFAVVVPIVSSHKNVLS